MPLCPPQILQRLVWYRTIIFLASEVAVYSFYMSSGCSEGVPAVLWRLFVAGKGKFVSVHAMKTVTNLWQTHLNSVGFCRKREGETKPPCC
jgi:hypothetical protein